MNASQFGPSPFPFNPIGPSKPQFPTSISSAAIVSLIFGILSPLAFIFCFSSIFTSLVAIVCGHVGLVNIKHAQGRLTGRGFAITGLILGYLMMALTIAAIAWLATLNTNTNTDSNSTYDEDVFASGETAKDRLRSAESIVLSDSHGRLGSGNSESAKEIATEYATEMKVVSEEYFTEGRKRLFQLSGGNFLTYCELHEGSCVFIVHVPSYKDYEKEAKKYLAELAWEEAVFATSNVLDEGDALAVALRGTFLYGDIMIGTHPGGEIDRVTWRSGKSDDLLRFFPDPSSSTIPPAARDSMAQSQSQSQSQYQGNESDSSLEIAPAMPPDAPSTAFTPPPTAVPPPSTGPERSSENANAPDRSAARRPPKVETPPFENKISVELVASLDASGWNVNAMTFARDNRFLVAGRLDQTLTVFDLESQTKIYQSDRADDLGQVVSLVTTRDDQQIIASGFSGAMKLFDLSEAGVLKDSKSLHKFSGEVKCLVVSPAYDFVLGGDRRGTLAWLPYDGRATAARTINGLKSNILAAHLPVTGQTAMATDGQTLLEFGLGDGNISANRSLKSGYAHAAAFNPDGTRVAVSHGNEIFEFATDTGQLLQTYRAVSGAEAGSGIQWTVAYHPTRPWLISGGSRAATVWDQETAQRLAVLDTETILYVQTMALTADGQQIAIVPASAGQTIKVYRFKE